MKIKQCICFQEIYPLCDWFILVGVDRVIEFMRNNVSLSKKQTENVINCFCINILFLFWAFMQEIVISSHVCKQTTVCVCVCVEIWQNANYMFTYSVKCKLFARPFMLCAILSIALITA